MLSRRLLFVLAASLLIVAVSSEAASEFEQHPEVAEEEEYEDAGMGILDFPAWRDFTARVQRHVDADGLLRARRWGNVVNGLLLGVTGPVALAISTFGMKLSNVVLSLYVTGFGGLLASLELGIAPVAPWVAKNLSYLTTGNGRTALLVFAGNLVWAFGRTGLVPALLTCANAVFNANFNKIMSFVQEDDDVVHVEAADVDATFSSIEHTYNDEASQHTMEQAVPELQEEEELVAHEHHQPQAHPYEANEVPTEDASSPSQAASAQSDTPDYDESAAEMQ